MTRFLIPLLILLLGANAQAANGEACDFGDVWLERPGKEEGATGILVGAYLLDLTKIDDVDQSFTADIFLKFRWQDDRLKHGNPVPCVVPADAIWSPSLFILNRRVVEQQMDQEVEITRDGSATYRQRMYGTFSFRSDLTHFPFDSQTLMISMLFRYPPGELNLVPDDTLFSKSERLSVANWKVGPPGHEVSVFNPVPGGPSIGRFDIQFQTDRRAAYHVWKLIVPMTLVVLMSWAVFWISPQELGPRVGLAATSVLTLIAFRLAVARYLPAIPYLTQLDIFTLGSTLIVFTAVLETVITTALWQKGKQDSAVKINRAARLVFPVALLLVIVVAFPIFGR